ncbi:MAG TPA: 30S ribosomal protein S5 [Firmicutes bacterium]|uniref:Small ribosomal subunit protein uS5 n=1 Tax=Candidatus Coatesbacteria bacterium 4484_99 TaxID=1970774 RepID=A0A1W9S0U4_9BACT|nr:MAG: 30S ribosomal protein S5 [Candidatus Coatesbacteria bacterium 4484_99]RLC41403.1 MAG: 30S ribosomal protein S5 [Candidatus Coatesbacteria bacterium]RLC44721.1 MAG: 30S ribosomal protein S5 [Candidatus Coatesbacteria bacterium]HDM42810.1 30S ribosomal protein S5 [Bacillota bacterium]
MAGKNKGEFIEIEPKQEIVEKVVRVNRYAKVHKGGRHFSFGALVVVGDKNGRVGFAQGKAREVSVAVTKGAKAARSNMFTFTLYGTTIPHSVMATYCSTTVFLKPARPGTGVIAGGGVRALLEVGGVQDIYTKIIGSTNPHNVLKATALALKSIMNPVEVMKKRGKVIRRFEHMVEKAVEEEKAEGETEAKVVVESTDSKEDKVATDVEEEIGENEMVE